MPWLFRPPDKMGRGEKAVWTFVMLALLGLELRTLYLDRNEHDQDERHAECEQLERFNETLAASQQQFRATMQSVSQVLDKTNSAADAATKAANSAREGVAGLTGSDSYVVIMPQIFPANDTDSVWLMVSVVGKHTVWDAHVLMSDTPLTMETVLTRQTTGYPIGAVSNTFMSSLTPSAIKPDKGKVNTYFFDTNSRGPFVAESLLLRFNQATSKWEYRFRVQRSMRDRKTIKMETLKIMPDWLDIPSAKIVTQQ